ncbi:hypothetical protein ACJW30_02G059000 [Castanea mollissima]
MANKLFAFEEFGFNGIEDDFSSSNKGWETKKEVNSVKQLNFNGAEDYVESWGIDSLCSDLGFYQGDSAEEGFLFSKHQRQAQQHESFSDYGLVDDMQFDIVSPPLQTCLDEIAKLGGFPTLPDVEFQKEKPYAFSLAPLKLLNNYGNGLKWLNGNRMIEPSNHMPCAKVEGQKFSTEEIMRKAGEKFIHSFSQTADGLSIFSHPFGFSFYGLSNEETKDVELAEFLFTAAEKVACQQFDRASKLLNRCDQWSSNTGNPVQRLFYYFSKALRRRIDRETGRITLKGLGKSFDLHEALMRPDPAIFTFHERTPFSQVQQFAGIQAIVENVAGARKIHIIDFSIQSGVQWRIFMQLLKITAVGITSKHLIEETGKQLASVAQTMNLTFSFKVLMVSDMLDLKEDLFELDANETVAVFCHYALHSMISQQYRLECIMEVVRSINPCILVVTEAEVNHNSPAFVSRFVETLFFNTAYFDCLETFMKENESHRMILESECFEERKVQNVKIDVWRAFFSRYGMVETELRMSSLYQANLVVQKFDCKGFCMLDMNAKSLIIGWKGTPICFLFV